MNHNHDNQGRLDARHQTCDDCESLRFDGRGRRICTVHGEQLCNHQRCESFQDARQVRNGNREGDHAAD